MGADAGAGAGPGEGAGAPPPAHAADAGKAPARPAPPWYRDRFLGATLVTVLVADQLSKYVISRTLDPHESWPADGLLRLTHGTNSGTIWGLFPNETFLLTILSFFAIGLLYYFYRSHAFQNRLLRLAIGLQLGGALGNLVDRVRLGEVIDFIDVGWWPVFNLADSSIVVGITILMAVVWLGGEPQRRTATDSATADTAD